MHTTLIIDENGIDGKNGWYRIGIPTKDGKIENFAIICFLENNTCLKMTKNGWKRLNEIFGEHKVSEICSSPFCKLYEPVNTDNTKKSEHNYNHENDYKLTFKDIDTFKEWVELNC